MAYEQLPASMAYPRSKTYPLVGLLAASDCSRGEGGVAKTAKPQYASVGAKTRSAERVFLYFILEKRN